MFESTSSFVVFNVDKLLRMIELYPNDFKDVSEELVRYQFRNYLKNVRGDPNFTNLKGLLDLYAKLVKTNKSTTFDLVNKLLKLKVISSI